MRVTAPAKRERPHPRHMGAPVDFNDWPKWAKAGTLLVFAASNLLAFLTGTSQADVSTTADTAARRTAVAVAVVVRREVAPLRAELVRLSRTVDAHEAKLASVPALPAEATATGVDVLAEDVQAELRRAEDAETAREVDRVLSATADEVAQ